MSRLTAKQKAFADYYIIHKNGVKAARLAGYKGNDNTLGVIAYENLRKPKIKDYIASAFRERVMTREEVLLRLNDIAKASAEDFLRVDEHDSRFVMLDVGKMIEAGKGHLIKKYQNTKNGVVIELHNSHEALRDIAKYYELFKDSSVEINQRIIIEYADDERNAAGIATTAHGAGRNYTKRIEV